MKSPKINEHQIHMGTFDYTVNFIWGDYDKAKKYVDYKFGETRDHEADDKGFSPRGRCWGSPPFAPIVWIPKKPSTSREYATLAHEMLHATCHLMDWASIPLTYATEEVYAHAQAHLVTSAINAMKKIKK